MPMGEGMTQQHITQEQAVALTRKVAASNGDTLKDVPEKETIELLHGLANAAIQHYLDQRKAELPVLPDPAVTNDDLKEMESKVDYWREQHADLGLKYDNLLQAFHIAETDVKLWKGTAKKARVEALEEAKQAAENCDVVEAKGNTYYAQLGDAAATQRGIVAAIEALEGK